MFIKRKNTKEREKMEKEDFFSKINFKDYNNQLENILEQKDFSSDVKNLLLSMLYKIENGYQDYETVKVNVSSKKHFLKKIIQIIQEKCQQIYLIKPYTEESKELEEKQVNYVVDKEQGKIFVYPNERMILEALITLDQKEILLEEQYHLFSIGMQDILTKGNRMNSVEVLRDFNGWSWDITVSQMESKHCNILYQNLLILLGNSFLTTWITDDIIQEEELELPNNEILRSKYNESFGITKEDMQEEKRIDYLQKMQEVLSKKYGSELASTFFIQFIKTVIAMGANRNVKQKEQILTKQKELEETLTQMQNHKQYLESISKLKREINQKIKQLDTLLSDEKSLKKEYEERNSKLPNKEKIFSVSHLKIMLEKERKNLLEENKEWNKQMEPKEFVRRKKDIEEKVNFFQSIGVEKEKRVDEEKQIDLLQNYFLACFQEKIKKAQTKKEISNLLYELRYYEQIPYEQTEFNKEKITESEKQIIKKACSIKLLTIFSEQEELNQKILKNQFQSKIINLANTFYVLKYRKGILKVQIYEDQIEEETKEIRITEKVELQVKLNKKIKVWE